MVRSLKFKIGRAYPMLETKTSCTIRAIASQSGNGDTLPPTDDWISDDISPDRPLVIGGVSLSVLRCVRLVYHVRVFASRVTYLGPHY